jgi:hypothetical protein
MGEAVGVLAWVRDVDSVQPLSKLKPVTAMKKR